MFDASENSHGASEALTKAGADYFRLVHVLYCGKLSRSLLVFKAEAWKHHW